MAASVGDLNKVSHIKLLAQEVGGYDAVVN